jgi:hypothetical protein
LGKHPIQRRERKQTFEMESPDTEEQQARGSPEQANLEESPDPMNQHLFLGQEAGQGALGETTGKVGRRSK